MKYILLLLIAVSVCACGKSSSDDEPPEPNYTLVKQELPNKVSTWGGYINDKDYESAKSMVMPNEDFWVLANEAASAWQTDEIEITYSFTSVTIEEEQFKPDSGTAQISGFASITQTQTKSVQEIDFTATASCSKETTDPVNWMLKDISFED